MKVCIVTVYNSTNCGSFLQAYALKRSFEKLGASVSFLDNKVKNNNKIFISKSLRNMKHGQLLNIGFDYKVLKNFNNALKMFELCTFDKEDIREQDLFVLGSDEIWNASREIMRNAKVFWGKGLKGRIVSYAPSVNTASVEDVEKIEHVRDMFHRMESITVRDEYSKKIISNFSDKTIQILCDPTFLLSRDEYDSIRGECPCEDFILIYSAGGRYSDKDIFNIRKFADKVHKKLISFPHRLKWCDAQYPADPMDAIAFFEKADYVITDTFHGTALSLIFNKKFVAIPKENTKVSELLRYYHLEDHIKEDTSHLYAYFSKSDYSQDALNSNIKNEREKAILFLQSLIRQ